MNIRDVIFTRNIINLKHTSTYSYTSDMIFTFNTLNLTINEDRPICEYHNLINEESHFRSKRISVNNIV